eukprot:g2827.t1
MARRYDSRTTVFSPEGRLYQVEYAMQAIDNAATAFGILCTDGVVLCAEKKAQSKLLARPKTSEKIFKVDSHITCAVAGLTADANILINNARLTAQRHRFKYQEPMPVESLIKRLCDLKQVYTQWGGLRPFGVSFLFAGWDHHRGFQLYHSDPSGNYGGWQATAIGNNSQTAKDKLKTDYKEKPTCEEALTLCVKVLRKTMDTTPSVDRMEFAMLQKDENDELKVVYLEKEKAEKVIAKALAEEAAEGDE